LISLKKAKMPALSNSKYESVAQAYIADVERKGARAYGSVYPKASLKACQNGIGKLLANPDFAARVAELETILGEMAAAAGMMAAKEILQELSAIGRANMADYMTVGSDGDPQLHFSELTREQTAALVEVTVETHVEGRAEDAKKVKKIRFKLHDKRAALVDLGRYYGLFKDRVEHGGKDGAPLIPEGMTENEVCRRIAFLLLEGAPESPAKEVIH
jgi:phage terminase small subunit